jgi:hypothetical protein
VTAINTQPLKGDGKVLVFIDGADYTIGFELDIEAAEDAIESFTNSLNIVKRNLGEAA